MNKLVFHINDFYIPHIAGPTKHIYDVTQNTYKKYNHIIISFDLNKNLKNHEIIDDIEVYRFPPLPADKVQAVLHFGKRKSGSITQLVKLIRKLQPICIVLYYVGFLPLLLRTLIPEARIVYMPFGYKENDFDFLFITKRFKIALCGEECVEDYISAGANPDQIHVIERPINTSFYTPQDKKPDKYRLLTVGRFHPMKRLPLFLQNLLPLFDKYPQLTYHVVADIERVHYTGPNTNELNTFTKIIQENNLESRVILHGKLVDEQLLEQYALSGIHILPSTQDRRATVTQEAITMGMQCINTCKKKYDWPEFDDAGKRLIHYVEDISDINPIIENMINHFDTYSSNRDYAVKNWSWDRWSGEYEKLFTEW